MVSSWTPTLLLLFAANFYIVCSITNSEDGKVDILLLAFSPELALSPASFSLLCFALFILSSLLIIVVSVCNGLNYNQRKCTYIFLRLLKTYHPPRRLAVYRARYESEIDAFCSCCSSFSDGSMEEHTSKLEKVRWPLRFAVGRGYLQQFQGDSIVSSC